MYQVFGLKFELGLSDMPERRIGDDGLWQRAIQMLRSALEAFGLPYKINKGEGAFYGPKIDIMLQDALGRKHQCGSVQVDLNGPERFNLQYQSELSVVQSSEPLDA